MLCLPIYPGLPRKVQEKVVQTLIQESIHSTESSRTLFQPFADAFRTARRRPDGYCRVQAHLLKFEGDHSSCLIPSGYR